jgi:SAM-dependent methyltransferase
MVRKLLSFLNLSSPTQLLYRIILPSLSFFSTATSFRYNLQGTIRTLTTETFTQLKQEAEDMSMTTATTTSSRLDSPSAQRNKEVIWNVLESNVFSTLSTPKDGHEFRVLEIAAGTGVHSHYFCQKILEKQRQTPFPSVKWIPTDPQSESRESIEAYREDVSEVLSPPLEVSLNENGIVESNLSLDSGTFDLIVCINMIHISPWEATIGLMKVAQRLLKPGTGILYCYGPYREGGTAVESNL